VIRNSGWTSLLSRDSKMWEVVLCLLSISLATTLKINGLIVIMILVLWAVSASYKKPDFGYLKNSALLALILFFLLHVIGLFYTENLKVGFAYIERIYTLLAFPLIMGSILTQNPNLRKKVLLSFSVSVLAISSLYLFLDEEMLNKILTVNRTYQGMYLLFSISILLYYSFLTPGKHPVKLRVISWGLIAYNIFLLVRAGSKMPILVFPLLLVVFLFYHYKQNRKIVLPLVLVITALVSISVFITRNKFTSERLQRLLNERFDYIRYRNWETNLRLIREHPIVGVGTGDAFDELQKKRETWWHEYIYEYNSHNQYLETTIRVGLVGLAVLLLCLFLLFKYSLKSNDFIFLSFIMIFAISCLTESLLLRQKGVLFFSFFAPFLLSTLRKNSDKNSITIES
jgi:O-antigen ligase